MLKNKRVFISGGNGVIGNALVEKLHQMGAVLMVGDLKPRPQNWPTDILYWKGDLNYISDAELKSFAPEYFFHLAATFERSKETFEFWEENYQHNVRLSHHLMTIMKDLPSIRCVLFASSYLIYDPILYNFQAPATQPYILKESDPIFPRNLTGAAKLNHEVELRFLDEFKHEQMQVICARIYRSFGKNSRDIISRWIRALLKGEPLTVFRKEGLFDYIYADEVAEGLLRLAETSFRGIINLGSGRARRVEEIVNILKQHFPHMRYTEAESDILYEASQADMSLFKKITKWTPQKQLEDAIPEIIAFEKKRGAEPEAEEISHNILVTSISKKVPMLKAIRNAAAKYGTTSEVHGGDISSAVIGKHFVDKFWEMPRINNITISMVIDYCIKNNIKLVIPSRDGELNFWSQHKEVLSQKGISVMVSSPDGIETCLDKQKFYEVLKAYNFPVITTATNIDDLKDVQSYVVKERYGAGSMNIGLNLSKQDAILHSSQLIAPVFQPFIYGKELSVDLYISKKGNVKGVIVRSRDVIINGESQITTTLDCPKLEELSISLIKKLGLYGHIVLQAIVDTNDQFHIIECNSRFGGASTLSIQCGLDSFYWAILEASGHDIDDYPFLKTKGSKVQIRYPEDIIINGPGI